MIPISLDVVGYNNEKNTFKLDAKSVKIQGQNDKSIITRSETHEFHPLDKNSEGQNDKSIITRADTVCN